MAGMRLTLRSRVPGAAANVTVSWTTTVRESLRRPRKLLPQVSKALKSDTVQGATGRTEGTTLSKLTL
jgi:hypothetical protein